MIRVLIIVACTLVACGSPEAKRAEAAGSYAAQQKACIDDNYFREDIDACRDRVKADWRKRSDAGAEGGTP